MNDLTSIEQRFRLANPIPDPSNLPMAASTADAALLDLEARSVDMQTQDPPIRIEPSSRPPRDRRWLILALGAAAAAVVAIVIAASMLGGSGEPQVDVVAPTELSPVETVTLWHERFDAGDVSGWQSLMSPDATFSLDAAEGAGTGRFESQPFFAGPGGVDHSLAYGRDSRLLYAANGSLNANCTADPGNQVTCDIDDTNLFKIGPLRHTEVFTVQDGVITDIQVTRTEGLLHSLANFRPQPMADYEAWLSETYPDDYAELFAFGTMLIDSSTQADRHRARIAEWASSGG